MTSKLLTQEHCDYLIKLRDSGETNMWGAAPYLEFDFGITKKEARQILIEWIQSFNEEK
jgi:hypothetical protein